MTRSAFDPHDHALCRNTAIARAEAELRAQRQRFTPLRRRVFELLLEEHRALGAYELLDRLAAEGYARQPPLVYRALEFLVAQGFVHRIRRLNAFIACALPGQMHAPAFLVCTRCGRVAELDAGAVRAALAELAEKHAFTLDEAQIEAVGLCIDCLAPKDTKTAPEAVASPGRAIDAEQAEREGQPAAHQALARPAFSEKEAAGGRS